MNISRNLGFASVIGALIATAALAQESGQAPQQAEPQQQETSGKMMDGKMMEGGMMEGGMMEGGMMGGDMKGMMQNCMQMMETMNEHMESHDHTGSDG